MAGRRKLFTAIAVGVLAISIGVPSYGAPAGDPKASGISPHRGRSTEGRTAQVHGRAATDEGPVAAFVELAATPAVDAAAKGGRAAAKAAKAKTKTTTDAVVTALAADDGATQELFRTSNAVPGVAVVADAEALRDLAGRKDVTAVHTLVRKRTDNAEAAVLTNVLLSWQQLGLFGDDMQVGIIDTGVDYTHTNFGGPGTSEYYDAVDPTDPTGVFPTAKVVGGYDFAGDAYDADSDDPDIATPVPDANPLDCQGHGSHVAGTAAGFGVNDDGSTFTGDYAALDAADLGGMRIGPGMAPMADVYALKVFGCDGSTFLTAQALDWALDPNGDLDFADHLDLINASLGSDYGAPDDPEALFVRKLAQNGVLSVMSAGNGGDFYDVGGSPGNTPEALTVASTRDAYILRDYMEVTAPAGVVGQKPGQYSANFDYEGFDLTDDVIGLTEADNLDGCDPFNATDIARAAGKIVWLEWDDNDATRRCGSAGRSANAVAAGATGAVLTSELDNFTAGIAGSAVIPVFQMTGSVTDALRPAMGAGTLVVHFDGDFIGTLKTFDPDIVDTPSGFTSRGTRSPGVKPDVGAPGDTIVSTDVGTGDGAFVNSGTSMASPHVAGIAALVRQAHPTWTVAEVKAAIMNTALHDLYTNEGQIGPVVSPNRVGAGRVDARAALATNVLAGLSWPTGVVSVGFGPVEVAADTDRITKKITVTNKGSTPATYNVAYEPIVDTPGASYELDKSAVTVAGRRTATIQITLVLDRALLRKVGDATMVTHQFGVRRDFLAEESGRVVLTPTSGATTALRVPVHANPKPVSALTAGKAVFKGASTTGTMKISGRHLLQGTGEKRYRSLLSVLELAATSPKMTSCDGGLTTNCTINGTAKGGDLRYVGVASTAPQAVADGVPEDSMLGFGLATWSNWYNLGVNTVPFVDIDVGADGTYDYETFVIRDIDTDLLEAWTVSLEAGFPLVDIEPINTVYDDVDSNKFDSNVMVMPVFLDALGIDPTDPSARLNYFVGVDGYYEPLDDTLVDYIDAELTFDPLQPGAWVEGTGGPALVFNGVNGTSLVVHRNPAALALDGSNSLLVLHHHNRSGSRAQVVPVL